MTLAPASLAWFAKHEFRLAWRDTIAMMTGGRRTRLVAWLVGGTLVYALLQAIAWFAIRPVVETGLVIDKPTLVMVSGMGLLFWTVTLSQAIEAVTRVYYARSDLDLILSSPASSRRLFAVRAIAVVASTASLGALLISPIVIALALQDGPHWLSAYLVLAALAALSTAIAMALTRLLFRFAGPKRTRLFAQILAGIVGAGFVIGIQAVAILSHEGFSRLAIFQSADLIATAPDLDSVLWWPAYAAMGNFGLTMILAFFALAVLALTIHLTASSYARLATSAAGLNHIRSQRRVSSRAFAPLSQRQALRRKEWRLLQRDPWLLSQTLMQLLYLIPPALLLWINYGVGNTYIVVVPVLVMAAGQLAGGIAWLAISGEDAHDLVATAPLTAGSILHAKVEAVIAIIAIVLGPILLLLAISAWPMALITAACGFAAAGAATAIQLWFRVPTKRAMFRRRQVASRAATLSEAFSSITWAGTAGLLAAGLYLVALLPALIALGVLGLSRLIAPRRP